MNYKFIYQLIALWLYSLTITNSLFSQEKKAKDNFLTGEYYFSQLRYKDALNFYMQTHAYDSTNSFINYRIGECLFNLKEQRFESIPYLVKASKNIATKDNECGYETGRTPIEVLFILGEVYQRKNYLDKALQIYLNYKDLLGSKDKIKFEKANLKIQSVAIAKSLIEEPILIEEKNLGPIINSRFSDYNPVVSANEKILIFTSFWESVDRIFMTKNENEQWTTPNDITEQIGSSGDCYTSSLTADGQTLYLIVHNEYNSDIYVSYFIDGSWSVMKEIDKKINSRYHETSVSISSDENTLFFSSNKPGGFGGFDLYCSKKKDGEWSKPINLGENINTPYNEEAPFITTNDTNLFFSSSGHRNMGGMDIFYSTFLENGEWSKPKNVGYPINSTGDDIFYIPIKNGKIAYYSKQSPEGFGRHDIYRVIFPINKIYNEALNEYIEQKENTQKVQQIKQYKSNTNDTLVIQIMALKKKVDTKYFNEFDSVAVYKCTDNLYHYVTGKFANYNNAFKYLEKVHNFGYKDAFLRTTSSFSIK